MADDIVAKLKEFGAKVYLPKTASMTKDRKILTTQTFSGYFFIREDTLDQAVSAKLHYDLQYKVLNVFGQLACAKWEELQRVHDDQSAEYKRIRDKIDQLGKMPVELEIVPPPAAVGETVFIKGGLFDSYSGGVVSVTDTTTTIELDGLAPVTVQNKYVLAGTRNDATH